MSREKQWKKAKKKKKLTFQHLWLTPTYLKLTFVSFFLIFFMNLSLTQDQSLTQGLQGVLKPILSVKPLTKSVQVSMVGLAVLLCDRR